MWPCSGQGEGAKAPCKDRGRNPRYLRELFILPVTPPTIKPSQRQTNASLVEGWHTRRKGGQGRGFLQKLPQLQHPHSSVVLAKLTCLLAPHGMSQTHVRTPWVTSPRLMGWGHLVGSLGVSAGDIVPFHSCTVAPEPADPSNYGQINVAIPPQGTSQLWAMGEAGKSTWPVTMDRQFIPFS